jgi:hypothetical protein
MQNVGVENNGLTCSGRNEVKALIVLIVLTPGNDELNSLASRLDYPAVKVGGLAYLQDPLSTSPHALQAQVRLVVLALQVKIINKDLHACFKESFGSFLFFKCSTK